MKRITKELKEQMIELANKGLNQQQIGAVMGVPQSTVSYWLASQRVEYTPKKPSHCCLDPVEVVGALVGGETIDQIAARTSVSTQSVYRAAHRGGYAFPQRKFIPVSHLPLICAATAVGLNQQQIGDCYGVSESAVSAYCLRHGLRRYAPRRLNKDMVE